MLRADMATDCPVCGDDAEHVRRERPDDASAEDPLATAQTVIEVDELCASGEERWDRICHSARVQDVGENPVSILAVYYHHFGDADGGE
jgi:hypothetical protein